MHRTVEKAFFALIRFEINDDKLCDEIKNLVTPEMLPALFKLSKRHDLAHLIGDALDKNGLLPDGSESKKRFLQERNMAVYRYEQLQYELGQICQIFEKGKISFIPLKGSVIRAFYPNPWMRTSCDIDVLVDKSDITRAILALKNGLDYQEVEEESTHDVSLFSPSGVHLELHYSLAEEGRAEMATGVLGRVWTNVKDGASFQKEMTDEMFYCYHIAHMAKHFEIGGCGVRAFLDAYILQKFGYSSKQYCQLLQETKLLTFAKAIEEAANVWFGEMPETEISLDIQEYILHAGMYADTQNRAAVQQARRGGRFKYVLSRIILPYGQLQIQYPRLKSRIWAPFYQVKRWFRLLFGKDSKNVSRELKANFALEKDKRKRIESLFKKLEV